MLSRSIGVQAVALVLSTALCGCSIVGLGYRAAPKHQTGHQEAERLSQLAELYERQGHPAGAMRLYRQALQVNPRSQQARERLMALSSQQSASPQAPAGGSPSLAPAATTMLAQTTPAAATPNRSPSPSRSASPVLAPEPPTTAIRAIAPRKQSVAVQQPAPTPGAQSSSVVAESASAVASAAAPLLALMSPATGNSPLRPEPTPPQVAAVAPVAVATLAAPTPLARSNERSPVLENTSSSLSAHLQPIQSKPRPLSAEARSQPLAAPSGAHVARLEAPPRLAAPSERSTEPEAAVAIVKLPPPARIEPESKPSDAAWTSNRPATTVPANALTPAPLPVPAADPVPLPVPLPAPDHIGIAIRPQEPADDVAGRATLHSSNWTATDLVRLCPDASEELIAIVTQLESPEAEVRTDGLLELTELADEARPVIAAVRSLFHDPEPRVKAHAAWAACRISGVNEECVAVLAGVTRCDDPTGATFAAYCLGLLESDAVIAVPSLQDACQSDNPAIRLCAAEALLKITPEAAEPLSTLIDGLRDPEPEHRWLAALSLSAASCTYQESAVLALIPALQDPVADVCSSAALALGSYGRASAVAAPELEAALSHPDADVREAASVALKCIQQ